MSQELTKKSNQQWQTRDVSVTVTNDGTYRVCRAVVDFEVTNASVDEALNELADLRDALTRIINEVEG